MNENELTTGNTEPALSEEPAENDMHSISSENLYAQTNIKDPAWFEVVSPETFFKDNPTTSPFLIKPEKNRNAIPMLFGGILFFLAVCSWGWFGNWRLRNTFFPAEIIRNAPSKKEPAQKISDLQPLRGDINKINEAIQNNEWGQASILLQHLFDSKEKTSILKSNPKIYSEALSAYLKTSYSAGSYSEAAKNFALKLYEKEKLSPDLWRTGIKSLYYSTGGSTAINMPVAAARNLLSYIKKYRSDYEEEARSSTIMQIRASAALSMLASEEKARLLSNDHYLIGCWQQLEESLNTLREKEPDSRELLELSLRKWRLIESVASNPLWKEDIEIFGSQYSEEHAEKMINSLKSKLRKQDSRK